jgi:hypothetical protein
MPPGQRDSSDATGLSLNDRGPDSLINGGSGQSHKLNVIRSGLAKIERGPTPYLDGVVRWRLCDLAQWIWEEFRISVSEETLGREVRAMGYRKLSARPRHQMNIQGEGIALTFVSVDELCQHHAS